VGNGGNRWRELSRELGAFLANTPLEDSRREFLQRLWERLHEEADRVENIFLQSRPERSGPDEAPDLAEDPLPDEPVARIARRVLALPAGRQREAVEWDALVDGLVDRIDVLEHVLGIASAALPDQEMAEEMRLDENDRVMIRDAREQIARVLREGEATA
jgi:hypothetical protein